MRRTLTVLVASAALLVPATAASAAPSTERVKTNASCSNGKGGNNNWDALTYSGGGNTAKAAGCLPKEATVEVDPCVLSPDLIFCKNETVSPS